jgi:hypothetical protein
VIKCTSAPPNRVEVQRVFLSRALINLDPGPLKMAKAPPLLENCVWYTSASTLFNLDSHLVSARSNTSGRVPIRYSSS